MKLNKRSRGEIEINRIAENKYKAIKLNKQSEGEIEL